MLKITVNYLDYHVSMAIHGMIHQNVCANLIELVKQFQKHFMMLESKHCSN
jgi:hypothetical protein